MKKRKLLYLIGCLVYFTSCGTYRYYHPSANTAVFHNQGEFHAQGEIGSSGLSVKGAYALPANIGIIGMYNTSSRDYQVEEGEVGLGYYTKGYPGGLFVIGGVGFGSNFEYTDSTHTVKAYEGEFVRPFIQLNGGADGVTLIGKLKADFIVSLKSSYFMYDGRHLTGANDAIQSKYFLFEPAFTMGLGTRVFRVDLTAGFPFHPTIEGMNSYSNARTMPATIGLALRFVLGREKNKKQ